MFQRRLSRLFGAGLALAGAVSAVAGSMEAEEPLNLLFFGNSFTMGFTVDPNDVETSVPDIIRDLAVADGHLAPTIITDLQGGTDLDFHIGQVNNNRQNNVASSGLASGETFDFVISQGLSTESTSAFGDGTFAQDALDLYQAVASDVSGNGVGAVNVLFQTWSRGPGVDALAPNDTVFFVGDDAPFPEGPAQFQAEVREGYEAARDLINETEGEGTAVIATVGDAFEQLGFAVDFSEDAPLNLYDQDIFHASSQGTLLAALVLYSTIYNEDVSDLAFSDLSESLQSLATAEQFQVLAATADLVALPEPTAIAALAVLGAATLGRRHRSR